MIIGEKKPEPQPTWEEVEEDGKLFYVHPQLGNICKLDEGQYVVLLPKIIKLGVFSTPLEAKQVAETCQQQLNLTLDLFNSELVKKP